MTSFDTTSRLKGIGFVLTSGCCWGFHGVLIKYAYTFGASHMQVFFAEALLATLFFACLGRRFFRGLRPRTRRHWAILAGIGISTIGVGNFLFLAFRLGPVAIAATLMFLYVPVVYLFSVIAGRQQFIPIKLIAICSILLGAVLGTELLHTLDQPGVLPAVLSAVAASGCYSLVFILTPTIAEFTTLEFRSFSVSAMGLLGCLVAFLLVPSLWHDLGENWMQFMLFALILGAVGQILPVITLMKGLPLTGSSLGGVLASVELPIAVFSAVLFLGESMQIGKVIGVCLVIGGIVVYNFSDQKRVVAKAD